MSKRKTYTARFELDEDRYWAVVAELGANKSAISDGQTLPKARRRIRQAIALSLDIPEDAFDVREEFKLPARTMAKVRRYLDAQDRLRAESEAASRAALEAAQALSELGISRRDAGDLLGVTGARVQQVLSK